MSILRTILHGITFGVVDSNEEVRRKKTPCYFAKELSKEEFSKIAIKVAKPIKRLKVSTNEQFVYGEVRSSSGISTWSFTLDFNDYGRITGNYWCRSQNCDSQIPWSYAKQLKIAIEEHLHNGSESYRYK